MEEIWKEIPNSNGWKISNRGRVMRRDGSITLGSIIKNNSRRNSTSYYVVDINCISPRRQPVHRLVAEAFIEKSDKNPDGTTIEGKLQVNHKDENGLNNNLQNLEWCDSKYNCRYGTRPKRCSQHMLKKVLCIETGEIFNSAKEADEKFGFNHLIANVCNPNNRKKSAGGYHWRYIS